MPKEKQLVINADDFGFAPGVNRGILEAYEAGTLTSASMMVNTPAFREAAALAREKAPKLGVGLHLNLLSGHPLTEVPSLIDSRTRAFVSLTELTRRALVGHVKAADVKRECDAQLAALAVEGIAVTHLDSHRHTHALPGILAPVLASVQAFGVRVVRRPLDQLSVADPGASAKMLVLHASWRATTAGLPAEDRAFLKKSPHFRGIALQGALDVEQRLLALLDRLPEGMTEIMLHPGYDDEVLAMRDPYRKEREREVAALNSQAVRERLQRGDIRLVSFAREG
jgi:predicted glycoside hydrolase/deacetylase ChbG (UPF0249 family)